MRTPLILWKPLDATGSSRAPLDPTHCPVQVDRGDYRWSSFGQCERKPRADRVRPVRDERARDSIEVDMEVCGVHANVYDKAVKREKDYADEREYEKRTRARAEEVQARLSKQGISAGTHYGHPRFAAIGVTLTFEEVEKLLTTLEGG